MAPILRAKIRWSGFTGGPGFSVFHFRDFATGTGEDPTQATADAANTKLNTFITAILPQLPNVVNLQVHSEMELIEWTNGNLIDVLNVTPANGRNGTAGATVVYSAAVGAVINYRTNGIRNNRRVRGRTFLVPLASSAYALDGSLASANHTAIQNAANALITTETAADLGVWARPTAPGASDGAWYVASTANVPDMTAVLRSRRN
jgi:hypothetical protein